MPLTAKEITQLAKLRDKQRMPAEPITEPELEGMETHIADVIDASLLADMQEFWTRWMDRYHKCAADNARLIAEVRRLHDEQARAAEAGR